jgi:hypothetical protein
VQTIWLIAMVVTAIGSGHTLGYIVLTNGLAPATCTK